MAILAQVIEEVRGGGAEVGVAEEISVMLT